MHNSKAGARNITNKYRGVVSFGTQWAVDMLAECLTGAEQVHKSLCDTMEGDPESVLSFQFIFLRIVALTTTSQARSGILNFYSRKVEVRHDMSHVKLPESGSKAVF